MPPEPPLIPLPIGPVSRGWLAEIGIESLDQLRETGVVAAYVRLKELYPRRVSLNLLYGLYSVLEGIPANHLSDELKTELRKQAEAKGQ